MIMKEKKTNKSKEILATVIISIVVALGIGVYLIVDKNKENPRLNIDQSLSNAINIFKQGKKTDPRIVIIPSYGEEFAKLNIPSLNFYKSIYEGDSDEVLSLGLAHAETSTLPGENGNVIIGGHRDISNGFSELRDIKKDDEVIIETSYGNYYYRVSEIKIVDKNDKEVGAVSDHEKLTMYTCYPFDYIGHAPNRYVVICDFVKVK